MIKLCGQFTFTCYLSVAVAIVVGVNMTVTDKCSAFGALHYTRFFCSASLVHSTEAQSKLVGETIYAVPL